MRGALALAFVAACSGEAATPDAGLDASPAELPTCNLTFDHAYIESVIQLRPPGEGEDIDGDGDVDNQLGLLALTQANDNIAAAVAAGGLLAVLVFPQLVLPPPPTPVDLTMYAPIVADADNPITPDDNFEGGGFLASLSAFDTSCEPRVQVPVVQDGTRLDGRIESTNPWGSAILDLRQAHFAAEVSDDGATLTGTLAGAYPSCTLDQFRAAALESGTILYRVVTLAGLQPDVDLDGDGFESFTAADSQITSCIDGDGTVIENPACACDPRIADGYSAFVYVEAVLANIVGTIP